MAEISFVDFRYGMVSERLRRRSDLSFYANSASLLENLVPLKTGGVKQREALVDTGASSAPYYRLIPLTVSNTECFLIAMRPYVAGDSESGKMDIYDENGTRFSGSTSLTHKFTASELQELSYAQTYDMLVMAQINHVPMTLTWQRDLNNDVTFNLKNFVACVKQDVYIDGELKEEEYTGGDYTYTEFLNNEGYYPAGVAFVANRLCFYNFPKRPYAFLMSKPFRYDNFQEKVWYRNEEATVTSKKYVFMLGKVQSTSYSTDKGTITSDVSSKTYENAFKKTETTVSTEGYYMTTVSICDEDANVLESYIWTHVYELKDNGDDTFELIDKGTNVNAVVWYSEVAYTYASLISDDCAINLEIASDRDETIAWMAQCGEYVYVGTLSSEWIMPSGITATTVQISKISSYGSKPQVACAYGMRDVFYVQSGEKVRAISNTGNGMSYKELSYSCAELFNNATSIGVTQIAWQRVPEPRLYVRTENPKELLVLCYDVDYNVQAWCRWTFKHSIRSICVLDVTNGQRVYISTSDNGRNAIFSLTDNVYVDDVNSSDWQYYFQPVLRTNSMESTQTFTYGKKGYKIYADTDGTNFSASSYTMADQSKKTPVACRSVKNTLSELQPFNQAIDAQGLRYEIKGKAGEAFTLYALILELEVQK